MIHNPLNHWLTVNECAALYLRPPTTIRRWCYNGTFSHFGGQVMQLRFGRYWRYYIRQTLPIFPDSHSNNDHNV